jgi:hypothetical protein
MNKILQNLWLFAVTISATASIAQTGRYYQEVFQNVTKQANVEYGTNFYFTPPTTTDPTNPQQGPLLLDLYTPTGDGQTNRPLVIYLHTGNFLPKYFNGGIGGSKEDSTCVEVCRRYAKRGFVAASVQYRLGWNPISADPDVRRGTLLNAVYRAIHDAQTAVRFFKKSVAIGGNIYGVDTTKITLIGQGSGGYVSLAYVTLDRIQEIQIEKFVDVNLNSYINTALVGNVDGTGGVINNYNHPGYSNEVSMAINLGGAIGDSSWLENTSKPIVSFHCPLDGFAPFDQGIVIVPTTGESVVPVSGSKWIIRKSNELGNNDIFANVPFNDAFSTAADARLSSSYPGLSLNPALYKGLYPFIRPIIPISPFQESSPWEFWDSATVVNQANAYGLDGASIHQNNLGTNPDMSRAKAFAYIDTIVGFATPRMIYAMGIDGVGINEIKSKVNNIKTYPNPTNADFAVQSTDGNKIETIRMFDVTGRVVFVKSYNAGNLISVERGNLKNGVYMLEVTTKAGKATQQVILQ